MRIWIERGKLPFNCIFFKIPECLGIHRLVQGSGVQGSRSQLRICRITDGGVLGVDLLMVQEPTRSSVFPVSLHHQLSRMADKWTLITLGP